MPRRRYIVTQIQTITLTHVIEAESAEQAVAHFEPQYGAIKDILEDDSEKEYEVQPIFVVGDKVEYANNEWTVTAADKRYWQDGGLVLERVEQMHPKDPKATKRCRVHRSLVKEITAEKEGE
jgi:hypothetical protein